MADADLQFDKATYTTPGAQLCTGCKRPLEGVYWQWQQHTLCKPCAAGVGAHLAKTQSRESFGKAALLGGGTAVGLGIVYAVVMSVSPIQLALLTIGIGYVVARVVRKASGGVSGRKFQILAAVLTYIAASMGYIGLIVKGVQGSIPITTLVPLALEMPFRLLAHDPLSTLIVAIGVYEAWRMTRPVPLEIRGPFPIAAGMPEAPGT